LLRLLKELAIWACRLLSSAGDLLLRCTDQITEELACVLDCIDLAKAEAAANLALGRARHLDVCLLHHHDLALADLANLMEQ
jgi:hypothetical protein